MHLLFVHQNHPAQFGHIADYLARRKGFRCTFAAMGRSGFAGPVELVPYQLKGGATERTHYCSRTFENSIWQTHAVYEALKARPDIQPDLVVGHSGFGSTLFLRQLYRCPIINYFEYFYKPVHSDMDFRPEFPPLEIDQLRALARNAMLLLDLEYCEAGYSPTRWQRDCLPELFHSKVRTVFDGIDINLWRPQPRSPRRVGDLTFPPDVRIVTYAARGLESMRGFDNFMRMANRLSKRRKDVVFVVVGSDQVYYGGDARFSEGKTFRDWVLSQDDYDLTRFRFLGTVPAPVLAQLFSITDLHIYLTVPFVLSWSLLNALACGATVLASDTGPVREIIAHGKNGLLTNFFDIEAMTLAADQVLRAPEQFRPLGEAGQALIRERYSMEVCLPQMLALYDEVIRKGPRTWETND
jgi:glycosyltransferase involved in cell wall biosynthesis